MVSNSKYYINDTNKYFSIDYSLKELSKNWAADPRTIRKYIYDEGYLRNSFMRFAQYVGVNRSDDCLAKEKMGLFCEVEPFLKCYFNLISSEYKSLYKLKCPKPEQEKVFFDALCKELGKRVCNIPVDADKDKNEFCRRVMLQNELFDMIIIRQQMEDQIKSRTDQICRESQNFPAEVQASVLISCLQTLDRLRCNLVRYKEAHPNLVSADEPPDPEVLFDALLEPRKQLRTDIAEFELPNTDVKFFNDSQEKAVRLNEAFSRLSCTKALNENLMEQTKLAFIHSMVSRCEKSEFEKLYMDLQGYLNLFDSKLDEAQLAELIMDHMKQACRQTIEECCHNRFFQAAKSFEKNLEKNYYVVPFPEHP